METILEYRGENGYLGLETGKSYRVHCSTGGGYFWLRWTTEAELGKFPPRKLVCCPYQSLEAFARNWKIPGK